MASALNITVVTVSVWSMLGLKEGAYLQYSENSSDEGEIMLYWSYLMSRPLFPAVSFGRLGYVLIWDQVERNIRDWTRLSLR